jgi:HSP20 family protein
MALKDLVPWRRHEVTRRGDPFAGFQREMNDLLDRFFGGSDVAPWPQGMFAPEVDVTETDKEVRVSAELPGVDEKDVDVSLAEDTITIKGEKKAEKEEKEGGRRYVERSYGSFERRIALPCEVDPDKAKAEYKKGVLTITLQKSGKAASSKKINISTAG